MPSNPNNIIQFDALTLEFTFYEPSDLSLAKGYIVTVMASAYSGNEVKNILIVTMKNPCKEPEYTGI